jgi:hypothetical protein
MQILRDLNLSLPERAAAERDFKRWIPKTRAARTRNVLRRRD